MTCRLLLHLSGPFRQQHFSVCPNNHGLKQYTTSTVANGVQCDLCGNHLPVSMPIWACRLCNFDICNVCHHSFTQSVTESAHKPWAVVKCTVCDNHLGGKDRVWSCRHCNFDACNACVHRATQKISWGEDFESTKNVPSHVNKSKEKTTILVVGRFGSGKSTLLNTLAGVYWNVTDGKFARNSDATSTEMFETSRSAKGCTTSATARDITTFDGREVTVIDTVGYDDTVNAESFYNTSNLTEVMDEFDHISAIVIVLNSQDPRLTQGFVESLLCIPKSFKKEVRNNIVLIFTKWNDVDEDQFGQEPYRGFTDQVNIVRTALGFEDDDKTAIPAFWMDNRPYKKCTENTILTIDNMSRFLDHVADMPRLSCTEFKEMRALSQYERFARNTLQKFFQPSFRNLDKLSGFEKFLFTYAYQHSNHIMKLTLTKFTAADWSKKLLKVLEKEVTEKLPMEVCSVLGDEAKLKLETNSTTTTKPINAIKETGAGNLTKILSHSSFAMFLAAAPSMPCLSLCALPVYAIIGAAYGTTWTKEKAIEDVVFFISQECGLDICITFRDQFTCYVDQEVEKVLNIFVKAPK